MTFSPGDVVALKSGGQPLTVVAVDEDSVECIWIGEEGEFFRETIPAIALAEAVLLDEEEDEEDEDEEHEEAAKSGKSQAA